MRDEESGELWGPTALPIREEARALRRPPRPGLQPLRAHLARHRARAAAVRPRRRSGEDLAARRSRTAPAGRAACSVTAYVEWVLGTVARRDRAVRRHRDRRRDRRAAGAQPVERRSSASRVAFADLGGRQTGVDRRPHGVPRPQRHPRPPGGARARPAAVRTGRRRPRSRAPRCRRRSSCAPASAPERRLPARPGARPPTRRARSSRATGRPTSTRRCAPSTTRWDDILGACRCRRPTASLDLMLNRWLLYQTLACRVWARSAFYQAGGAYGFRDQLQDVMALTVARRRPRARASPARGRAGSSSRATCSTGGIRPSGRGVRTRISDDLAVAALRGRPLPRGDRRHRRSSTRCVPFLEGPALAAGAGTTRTSSPTVSQRDARPSSSTARARSTAAWRVGAHGLPLMGTRRLERRHEPRRPRGQGRERLARLVPAHRALGVRARRRAARRARRARDAGGST